MSRSCRSRISSEQDLQEQKVPEHELLEQDVQEQELAGAAISGARSRIYMSGEFLYLCPSHDECVTD